MTRISVTCPKCGHVAVVEIATIDSLRAQLDAMTRERDDWRAKALATTGLLKQARENPFAAMFGGGL